MLSFPNAKINLGLNIIEKRTDGFHNIETVFYPIQICDALEVIENKALDQTELHISGIKVESDPNNLVMKAYELIKKDFDIPSVEFYLRKKIPLGAGLGGGSSDAAFTLKMLNDLFELQLSNEKLEDYAAQLGSDCSFFIENKPVFASGRGEVLETIDISLKGLYLIVVKPAIHVSTVDAYSGCQPKIPEGSLKQLLKLSVMDWKEVLVNDFESHIFKLHPMIKKIKNKLYENGAIYASMSGSGASVYGIFEEEKLLKNEFLEHFYWGGKLQ